ncbi:MAG TPA: DUF6152 family protein [Gammaproteobacteria bacterium]|nr:DUF6152 family protein [Gammaproteobacteria bacterium]
MRSRPATMAAALALVCAGSVRAHHSGYVYQTTPIWIAGTVTRFELKNPHAITTIEGSSEDGQVRVWAVEGPSQTELDRRSGAGESVPKVGDTLKVCAFPYKPAEEIARDTRLTPSLDDSVRRRLEATTTDGASPRLIEGHVLVMPDGGMRSWDPHGILVECVRTSNAAKQVWVDFLNTSSRARELWCQQRRYEAVQSNAPLRDLVEEINGQLESPCP